MTKPEMFELMNKNPVFYLATSEGNQPRVRGMLLYRADERGILFHTSDRKDLYGQLVCNPRAELCFFANGVQLRVSGSAEVVTDKALKEEIVNHPTRKFLKDWIESDDVSIDNLAVFRISNGTAVAWTNATNFAPKAPVRL